MQPVGGRAYFRCQYCYTFEFPQTAEDGVVELSESSDLHCPVCERGLASAAMEGHTVNFCGQCRGVLTTNALFSQIVSNRRAKNVATTPAPQPLTSSDFQRRLRCPQCERTMDTHPYGGGGAVVVDTCPRCHLIWLDAGEIDDIARHRPHGKPEAIPPVLYSTAGSCRPPEAGGWRWGDVHNSRTDYETGGFGLLDILRRLL
jgi:Zn-finger nucleic acid-binding protein